MLLVVLAPLIAALVIGLAFAGLRAQNRRQLQLVGRVVEPPPRPAPERPSILYFTGVNCTICHTAQKPALESLRALLDSGVVIREVDVADEPELARSYRVMSLPTTIVLNADGEVRAINAGFASVDRLRSQVESAGVFAAA